MIEKIKKNKREKKKKKRNKERKDRIEGFIRTRFGLGGFKWRGSERQRERKWEKKRSLRVGVPLEKKDT